MGIVAMKGVGSYVHEGYNITQSAYCLYCDKCGSFNIGKRITLLQLISILIVAIITALIWNNMGGDKFVILFCFGMILLVIGISGVFQFGNRCRKCGNRRFTWKNSLNYPTYDLSILDVPYEATIKYELDDY